MAAPRKHNVKELILDEAEKLLETRKLLIQTRQTARIQ